MTCELSLGTSIPQERFFFGREIDTSGESSSNLSISFFLKSGRIFISSDSIAVFIRSLNSDIFK